MRIDRSGGIVVKRFQSCRRSEHVREWTALTLLATFAPGLAPAPVSEALTGQPTAGGIPMHAPDDSTTPSRSVTVMRRLIRPWEYRHLRAVAGVRWPDER